MITTSETRRENSAISVIMPVYNAENWVREAVASIVDQKHVEEVLLVEDGSTDNSFSVCSDMTRTISKVHVFRHENGKNLGAGASRNLGIQNSKSDYIAFLDADDICLPDRFHLPMQILTNNPAIDGVYEAIGTIYEDINAKGRWDSLGWGDLTTVRKILQPEALFYYLVMWKAGHFSLDGLVIRKNLFYRSGGFNSLLRLHQDTDICIKLAAVGNLVPGKLNEPVALRRVHSDNRSIKKRMDALQSRILLWRSLSDWAKESRQSGARQLMVRYNLLKVLAAQSRQQRKWVSTSFYFAMSHFLRPAISILSINTKYSHLNIFNKQ